MVPRGPIPTLHKRTMPPIYKQAPANMHLAGGVGGAVRVGSNAIRDNHLRLSAAALSAVSSQGVFSLPTVFFQVWHVSSGGSQASFCVSLRLLVWMVHVWLLSWPGTPNKPHIHHLTIANLLSKSSESILPMVSDVITKQMGRNWIFIFLVEEAIL